jgi:8-oxo-dGTP pyrophosphatase MutT (NUDIX family)
MTRDYAIYQVSLKILLRKGNEFLFLKSANGKYWDLPGGRIDNVENDVPLEKILTREVKEELGSNLKYKLGKSVLQYRKFPKSMKLPLFFSVYEAEYLSGDIKLSFEHSSHSWLDPKKYKLNRSEFASEGEYLAFKEYFKFL